MLDFFLNLDARTLLMVLFAGNMISVGLISAFYYAADTGRDWASSRHLFLAKALMGVGFFLMLERNFVSPLVSVNLGNTINFIGFYFEALSMLRILNETQLARRYLLPVSVIGILGFNVIEFLYADTSLRVASASICLILILSLPCARLFVSPNSGKFKRWVGVLYLCILVMLFPRTVYALTTDMHLFTNAYIQTLTFLAMALQLVFSLPAYLLLIKEDSDQIIARMATTDMLTGLPNRYSFLDSAQRVFLRSRFSGGMLSVLFLDIDFFKAINDKYGHSFGDEVLAAVGHSIRDCLRPTDLSCRYGGGEVVGVRGRACGGDCGGADPFGCGGAFLFRVSGVPLHSERRRGGRVSRGRGQCGSLHRPCGFGAVHGEAFWPGQGGGVRSDERVCE